MIDYVPLHQHSTHSALDGAALHPELAARCVELGHAACALTDHGVTLGHFAFDRAMRKVGVRPILGNEMYLVPNLREKTKQTGDRREGEVKAFDYSHLTVLARTPQGHQNLLRLTTISHREGFSRRPRIDLPTLFRHQEGLLVLSGCVIGEASKLINQGREEEAFAWLQQLSANLECFFVELIPCPGLPISDRALPWLHAMATELKLPLVASDDAHFVQPEDFAVQDTLLCVNTGQKVRGPRKIQLPTIHWRCSGEEVLARLQACLPAVPVVELQAIVERSVEVAALCEDVELPQGAPPVFTVPEAWNAQKKLCNEAWKGLHEKLPADPSDYCKQLEHELNVFGRCEMANYLLVVWDLVREMRARNILVVPRGSAGGSLVLWALGITVVDPIKHNLSFSRFCDESKRDLDIDLDFDASRRHEAFTYLEEKYGTENCAHVANVVTFGARQALLDAGKALEIPEGYLAALAHLVPEGEQSDAGLHDVGVLRRLFKTHPTAQKVLAACPDLAITARLEGHVRNTSVHAGGFLVSARPLAEVTALMGKEGEARIVSLTKDEAAALGLLKIDILGSKTLTAVAECLQELGKDAEWLYNLPLEDPAAFQLMAEGRNLGLFQLQGTAAGRIMRELQPQSFEDFTAVSALARPGPLQSGSVKRFVARARGHEELPPMHPLIDPLLRRTQGVLLYQEQVMALAAAAGFLIEDVQKLRKLVSKIEGADKVNEAYLEPFARGLLERGVSLDEVEATWWQILKAGNYLFPEAHAVQYAYVGMWTAYLKAHHPSIYTAALCRNMSAKAEEKAEDRQFRLLREFAEAGRRVELLDPNAHLSFREVDGVVLGGWTTLRGVGLKLAEKMTKLAFESWGVLLEDPLVPKTIKKAISALGLPAGQLDSDAIQHYARWYPYRPLMTEEERLRQHLGAPPLRQLAGTAWADRHEATVLGRVTTRRLVDLVQQQRKYGGTTPKPGEREKVSLTLTDESGSLDLSFSAKIWRQHREAGLQVDLGTTLAARVWWHSELQRWYISRAEAVRQSALRKPKEEA